MSRRNLSLRKCTNILICEWTGYKNHNQFAVLHCLQFNLCPLYFGVVLPSQFVSVWFLFCFTFFITVLLGFLNSMHSGKIFKIPCLQWHIKKESFVTLQFYKCSNVHFCFQSFIFLSAVWHVSVCFQCILTCLSQVAFLSNVCSLIAISNCQLLKSTIVFTDLNQRFSLACSQPLFGPSRDMDFLNDSFQTCQCKHNWVFATQCLQNTLSFWSSFAICRQKWSSMSFSRNSSWIIKIELTTFAWVCCQIVHLAAVKDFWNNYFFWLTCCQCMFQSFVKWKCFKNWKFWIVNKPTFSTMIHIHWNELCNIQVKANAKKFCKFSSTSIGKIQSFIFQFKLACNIFLQSSKIFEIDCWIWILELNWIISCTRDSVMFEFIVIVFACLLLNNFEN